MCPGHNRAYQSFHLLITMFQARGPLASGCTMLRFGRIIPLQDREGFLIFLNVSFEPTSTPWSSPQRCQWNSEVWHEFPLFVLLLFPRISFDAHFSFITSAFLDILPFFCIIAYIIFPVSYFRSFWQRIIILHLPPLPRVGSYGIFPCYCMYSDYICM